MGQDASLPATLRNHATKQAKSEFATMRELEKQFIKTTDFMTATANPSKNRYSNVLANEDTRVKLEKDEQFYINANYISVNDKVLYIAGQGPLPNTIYDFWRMIIEEDVKVILMLANVIENNTKKCEKYWANLGDKGYATPDDNNTNEQREIFIENIKEEVVKNEIVDRTIRVGFSGFDSKIVHIVHMTTWPDFGVPNLDTFSEVVYLANRLNTNGSKIYVHCSAGIGRTGTFALVDSILKDFQNNVEITPQKIMERAISLKKQRFGMIQTSEQYHFAYSSIANIIDQTVNNVK